VEQSPSSEPNSHSAIQEIPALYRTRHFITVFARFRDRFISWATWIRSTILQSISL